MCRCGAVGWASDLRSRGRGFASRLGSRRIIDDHASSWADCQCAIFTDALLSTVGLVSRPCRAVHYYRSNNALHAGLKVCRYASVLRTGTSEKSLRQYRHFCHGWKYAGTHRHWHGGRCWMGQVGHGPTKILVGWACTMHLAPQIFGPGMWHF